MNLARLKTAPSEDAWIERQNEDPENAPTGYYQDGEFIETYVAPACGHEMFDESEIDAKGFCVNCSDLPAFVLTESSHSEGTAKALTSGDGEAQEGTPMGRKPNSCGAQNLSVRDLQDKLGPEAAGLVWALKQLDKYLVILICFSLALITSCDKQADGKPKSASLPWTVVCDEQGHFNFTFADGEVNPYFPAFSSYEEAEEEMKYFIELSHKEHPLAPKYNYKICPYEKH